jgi:hypothetical protein
MSALLLVGDTAQLVAAAAGGDGILDWGNGKITEAGGLLRGLSVVVGIGFVIWQAIASRGAMARIVMSGLAAAVFIWIVFNVTALRDRVDNEVNSSPTLGQHHPDDRVTPPSTG